MRGGRRLAGAEFDRLPRWRLPVPESQRSQQPFIWTGRHLLAPWPVPKGALPLADRERLEAVAERVAELAPGGLMWVWPDKAPAPIRGVGDGWLAAQVRDRAGYRIE